MQYAMGLLEVYQGSFQDAYSSEAQKLRSSEALATPGRRVRGM